MEHNETDVHKILKEDRTILEDDHKKARIGGLVHQLKEVNAEIHHVVDTIKEDVEKAQNLEATLEEKKALMQKNLTAALLVISEAEPKIRDLKEEDIVALAANDNPPRALEALGKCCVYLLANIVPNELVAVDSEKKPKETDWSACQRLFRDGKAFLEGIRKVRERIDKLEMNHMNMECIKLIMNESFYDFEKLKEISGAGNNIYSYIQGIQSYYDLVYVMAMSKKDAEVVTAKLEASSAQLLHEEEEVQKLKDVSDQLYKELAQAAKEN